MEIYTQAGWVEVEQETYLCDTLHGHNCECGEPAVTITDAGGPLWAQCADCAHETECESRAALDFEERAHGLGL
jgi:hypothetical protein